MKKLKTKTSKTKIFLATRLVILFFLWGAHTIPANATPLEDYQKSIDYSCQVDADCVIKDVGNCCGSYPMCVNKAAKTNPKLVQEYCAQKGLAGVCGFPSLSGCHCIATRCEGYFTPTAEPY